MSSTVKDRLFDKRTQIKTNILQVHSNKLQCEYLSSRIDQLIDPLERLEHTTSLFLRQETRPILDNFLQCLDDCNNFIEKFSLSDQSCEEAYEHENSLEKFEELNKRLSQFGQDLCLGLNIQEIFRQKQDQEDLSQKTNQILQQQQEQKQLLDKIFHQQFPSQTKTFLDQKTQFLHIPYKDLHIKEKPIGSGGFADVYKGTWLTHHDKIAIKVLRINHLFDDFYQEISILYQIRYEHVVTFLGACIEPNFYAIIFEYMQLGSLYDVLHGNNEIITLSWSDRYSLAWQMAKSINYLHNLNPYIIHRDIKSMNFLLKQNGSNQHRFLLKVCDFGLAEIRRESLLQSTSCQTVGSLAWKAPELLISHGKNTKQSDVYSLGMTMWELATGKKPWDEHLDETVIAVLVKIEERPEIPADVPEEYKQAIEDAWNQDPQKRPSCFDLMERMWKQIRQIKKKDELIILAVDLHGQQTTITTAECILPTNTDSTRTAVSVTEENKRFTSRLSSIIISDCQPSKEELVIITETDSESSLIDKQQISTEPDKVSTNPHLERSLSKSAEDLSLNYHLLNDHSFRQTHLSRSSINLHRSIIGRTIMPSNINDQNNHTHKKRCQSIIKQDTDRLPLIYKF